MATILNVTRLEGIDNEGLQLKENGAVTLTVPDNVVLNMTTSTTCLCENPGKTRKRSLVQLTREALPRLENYRNSKKALKRPSIGELLHGREDTSKEMTDGKMPPDVPDHQQHVGMKLGWIQGVLIPCLLNIWGVMLFLRLSWVVAQAGIGLSILIIAVSFIVCVITTLSLSAISTNGEVKGGGIYYIISRSLGPEFGASVGIVFAVANAVSASMNTIGFCDSLNDLLASHGLKIIDGGVNDVRIIGTIAIFVMILICALGMEWESKFQNILIAIIVGAIFDFLIGCTVGPLNDDQRAKGFVGLSAQTFRDNWSSDFRKQNGINYDLFAVFAIFFPSVTGLQAGANISGDLKDPASSIPKGTLLSLLISMISYAVFVFFAGAAAMRDASGNMVDLINGTLIDCRDDYSCQYGLFNSYSVMQLMSTWGPFIYAGCWAATLSTALTNLLSVPRLVQALGIDRIYPGLIFFSKGYGKANEPYRGYVLTFFLSTAFLLIADLNLIAPLISNFYLASYALINFCTFHAALIRPLGWRPTFRYYNTWLSLAGFIMCVVIMFLINWQSSLITFIVILSLYLIVVYRKPDVNWGSSTQAQTYKSALSTAHRLTHIEEHVKNYQPQIIVLCGKPQTRAPLLDFANLITKNNSLLIAAEISESKLTYRTRSTRTKAAYKWFERNKIKAFYKIIDGVNNFEMAAKVLMQSVGIGKLSPNVLLIGYKNDWKMCNTKEILNYFNILHSAFDNRLSVAILRLPEGLDFSSIIDEDKEVTITELSSNLNKRGTTEQSAVMMHADSNLSISKMQPDSVVHSMMPTLQIVPNTITSKKVDSRQDYPIKPHSILMERAEIFKRKQSSGTIDVWWLYDDGGLTMLLPYIISTRQGWSSCKLRVFALLTNTTDLEMEQKNMAKLLSKFRLEYSTLQMVQLSDKPKGTTIDFFNTLIDEFREKDNEKHECTISELELTNLQDKTHRHLRLRELLLENSSNANLVVMSMPMPRKEMVSPTLYMAWLEVLTRDLPPYLLVRGNQQSVLTFYS